MCTGRSNGRGENSAEGVTGLKKLGVREMSYKILFVACSISHTENIYGLPNGILSNLDSLSNKQIVDFTTKTTTVLDENDKAELLLMLQTPHLYGKLVESICPGVFGHHEIKRGILLMLFGGAHKRTPEG